LPFQTRLFRTTDTFALRAGSHSPVAAHACCRAKRPRTLPHSDRYRTRKPVTGYPATPFCHATLPAPLPYMPATLCTPSGRWFALPRCPTFFPSAPTPPTCQPPHLPWIQLGTVHTDSYMWRTSHFLLLCTLYVHLPTVLDNSCLPVGGFYTAFGCRQPCLRFAANFTATAIHIHCRAMRCRRLNTGLPFISRSTHFSPGCALLRHLRVPPTDIQVLIGSPAFPCDTSSHCACCVDTRRSARDLRAARTLHFHKRFPLLVCVCAHTRTFAAVWAFLAACPWLDSATPLTWPSVAYDTAVRLLVPPALYSTPHTVPT